MKVIWTVLFSLLWLFGLFGPASVKLSQVAPSAVNAGEEFEVTVKVDKGGAESFARFQVNLPRGLTALEGSAPNAAFEFEEQQLRLVWLRLPQDPEFTITYRVQVDSRMRGSFNLGGELAYVADNARQVATLTPASISIKPSPQVDPAQQLDIEEYQKSIPAQRPINLQRLSVRCIREKPTTPAANGEYLVRLLVNKGEAERYAKIEERIPASYTAEPVETQGGMFSFEGGVVRFVWSDLPPDEMFTVVYRLIPVGAAAADLQLSGVFSFMFQDAPRSVAVAERSVSLETLNPEQKRELVKSTPNRPAQPVRNAARGGTTSSEGALIPEGPSVGGVDLPVAYQKISDRPSGRASRGGGRISMDEYMLEPEQGVYYRVQVAAGHRPINITRYFKRLALEADVRTEKHEGWYKYSVGSFKVYKEARDYRTQVWNTTPIRDAFVAAYNDGRRITVQEALMITSQRWYK